MKNIMKKINDMKNLRCNNMCLRALVLLCLLMASVGAWAQTYYVFQNGTNGFIVYNGTNSIGVNATFSPSAVWIANDALPNANTNLRNVRSYVNDSRYLNGNTNGTFSLGNSSNVWRTANGYLAYRNGSTYYVKYNDGFSLGTANSGNRFTAYTVEISSTAPSLSAISISGGTDEMTATGNSPAFSHSNATYTPLRTNYRFNGADHYVNGASATVEYSWSLSGIEATYAEVTSAGVVRYKSLIPERERTATLTCTATAGGLTQKAIKEITFVNLNKLYSPSISYINAAGGKVSVILSYPESDPDVKLYYTTNGSNPSASSTLYTAPFEVASNTTIKVIAVKGSTTSGVVSEVVTNIPSGVSGGKVVLYDYEDHNWTYYSGVEIGDYNTKNDYKGKLYSPNPRNVKITYLGKGKMRTGNDASNLIDVPDATRVSVGLGTESENIFVYYKTLERNANNRYEYTTIPNPFQVRPTYASDATTKWRGFQSWRIKSIKNGAIYNASTGGTALAAGDMLNAETSYYFVPTDANGTGYTPNCTSMEIELEAVWARAYVDNSTNVGYERNFRMITANSNAAPTTYTYPTTYTSVYPNGCTTATGNTLATGAQYRIGSAFTAASDTKFEYVILRNSTNNTTNASNTIDAACHNLVIGRGVVGYNGGLCATEIRGYAANDMDFTLRIESGSYTTFHALRSGGQSYSGICKVRSILGCDYDRAKKDNSKLDISTNMWMGQSCKFSTAENRTQGFYKCWIKSGDLLSGVTVNGSNGTGGTQAFYYGTSGTQGQTLHLFPRYLYMEGGQVAGLAGGLDDRTVTNDNEQRVYLRMTGGFVRGPIYGAGAYAVAAGRRNYILTGGEVGGWIAAGCNGIGNNTDQTNNGTTTGDSFVYVGGTVRVGYKGTTVNNVEGGNVFGAGRGAPVTTYDVGTVNNSNVVVADEAMVEKNVYGGGNYGFSKGEANIYITGGTVDGKVFGGSNMMKGDTPNMYMTGGLVKQGVYGGCNTEGTIAKNVTMNIVGGQVGTDGIQGNVHGGGLGNATVVSGKVDLTIGGTTPKQPVIYGNVYGGSESGDVNGNAYSATNTNTTKVTLNNGIINGSLYGGAWGRNREAFVYGPVTVTVNGGTVTEAVYGCNNAQGCPRLGVDVIINGTDPAPAEDQYALKNVFGGGNAANYTYTINNKVYPTVTVNNCDNSIEYVYGGGNAATVPGTDVTIHGGNVIGNVFGGGYGANITTKGTKVTIDGGTILNVYGGSNSSGTITGGIAININEANSTSCPINIDNVFGGGNRAASAAGSITIGCASHIGSVYGGANRANISGDINLSIVSGHIDNVFGGNNIEGDISGKITVTVNDNNSACGMLIGNVYGAGNLAAYNPTNKNFPVVNIQNGHLTGSVYGAGKGDPTDDSHEKGMVTANPQVTIGQPSAGTVHIDGNVFGGGDAANVVGKPAVLVQNCSTQIGTKDGEGKWNATGGTVYGGGNAAHVTGTGSGTSVTINGGDINRVFGGGNGEVSPANVAGDAVTTIHAGNIHQAFAGSNMQGNISGSATITVDHDGTCDEKIDEVYGGGNQAAGNAGTVTIDCGAIVGDVYGGANQADINSAITLNITGGTINRVFGGNNTSGNISGAITVNVNKSNTCDLDLNYVYGGGNQAGYTAPATNDHKYPEVNILNGTITGSVFGGGLGSTAVVTGNPKVTINAAAGKTISVGGSVFGGGSLAPIDGSTDVKVLGNSTIEGNVYGGGNQAEVSGKTKVQIGDECVNP